MMRERLESQARIVWKSFLGALPVICFYLFLFCTVLALFGTQYIMVVSLVTVLFQTNYRKRKSWASLVRAAAAQLGLGLLAWIATWSFPLSVGLNLIVPFALVFLKATRFNKMGYFSGLMTFTFLQLLPVDLAGFFVQTGAMLYSLACFFLLVKLYQRRYPQEKSYRREQEGLAILADCLSGKRRRGQRLRRGEMSSLGRRERGRTSSISPSGIFSTHSSSFLGNLTRGRGTRRGRPGPCQGTSGLWESCCTRCGRTALRLVLPCA